MTLSFDGSGDHATYEGTAPATAVPVALFSRFKPTDFTGSGALIGIYSSTVNHRFSSLLVITSGVFRANTTAAATGNASTVNGATAGAWNSGVAMMAATNSRRAVLNADFANAGTETTTSTPTGLNRVVLGSTNSSAGLSQPYKGLLAECGILNAIPTDEEIAAFHAGWSAWRLWRRTLIWYAPFPTAGTVHDWVGGRNPTVTDAVASADGPPAGLP